MASLAEIAAFLDATLHTAEIPDYPNALNGVQVETEGAIRGVAAAVDARESTIDGARAAGANLLIVHHGLFWGGLQPIRHAAYRRLRTLLRSEIAVYSSHLPLDAHAAFGNNALLARALGLDPTEGFARHETVDIGVAGTAELQTEELVRRATEFARGHGGTVRHAGVRPGRVTKQWAICTGAGAAQDTLREAFARGIDTLITGEGPHWSAVDAEEQGLAVIYAGHYATEVLGVRAIGEHTARRFAIPFTFLDAPTGL